MAQKLTVSASPHAHGKTTTQKIMLDVLIALLPALVMAGVRFGVRALLLCAVCIASAVAAEYLSRLVMKRSNTISDLSAVVTGLLLAFCLPPALPLWMGALGSIIAIVVVKQCFGGLGQNFVNPALTARIILMLCFPVAMTTWTSPAGYGSGSPDFIEAYRLIPDGATTATPLMQLQEGFEGYAIPLNASNLLLGSHAGCLGEVCSLALLAGGLYLLVRRVISPVIPLCYIGTVGLFTLFYSHFNFTFTLYQLLSGGLILGAFFMATDYVTSPINNKGRAIFAVGCGLVTAAIRLYGSMPEGVSYAIVFMNIFVPFIDRATLSRPFGAKKQKEAV